VYEALVYHDAGALAPQELITWDLAERFGWTLDYIEDLSMARLHEWAQIVAGRNKADEWRRMMHK
jgi:hypothetical protein